MPFSQTTGSPAPPTPARRRRAQNPSHIRTPRRGAVGADGIRPLSFPRKRESRGSTCVSLVPVGVRRAVPCRAQAQRAERWDFVTAQDRTIIEELPGNAYTG